MKTSMLTLAMWCAMTTAMAQTYQVPVSEAHEQMLAGKWWEGYDPQKLYATQTTEGLVVNLPQPCNKIAPVLKITK